LLDDLKADQSRGLWVAPFGAVAAYLRAQKILEAAQPQLVEGEEKFVWKVPNPFPPGVTLKTAIKGGTRLHVYQGSRELHPSKAGVYSVSFDSGELSVIGSLQ
jgi:hypothetical protein